MAQKSKLEWEGWVIVSHDGTFFLKDVWGVPDLYKTRREAMEFVDGARKVVKVCLKLVTRKKGQT